METTLVIRVVDGIAIFTSGQAAVMWKTLVAIGLSGFVLGMAFALITFQAASWYHRRKK